jgi:hypothetical protein
MSYPDFIASTSQRLPSFLDIVAVKGGVMSVRIPTVAFWAKSNPEIIRENQLVSWCLGSDINVADVQ